MTSRLLVLWDVDHTLMESGSVGVSVFHDAFLAATGRELVHKGAVAGRTEPAIFRDCLALHGIPYRPDLYERYAAALASGYQARAAELAGSGRAKPGAAAAIAALAAHGNSVQSVLTGNLASVAAVKLAAFGLDSGLDLEIGAYGDDDEIRANLVPVAAKRVTAKYGGTFPAAATVLIGDTPNDVRAALDSGSRIVAVATGWSSAEELRDAGAATVLPDLTGTAAVLDAVLGR